MASSRPVSVAPRLLLSIFLLVPALAFVLNYGLFQQSIDGVLQRDDRNAGMAVRAHWRWYVDPTVLVYDLREAAAGTTGVDVLRAFLQFAYHQKGRRFGRVVLAWRGEPRFQLAGADFAELGRQFPYRSPVDTMVVIPRMVRRLDGVPAYPRRGAQAFLDEHQQALTDFNRFVNAWTASAGAR